jgi:hypothetical protein
MFIFKDTLKRANPYAPYTAPDGTRYPRIPMELLEEIQEPSPPEEYLTHPQRWYRNEQDDAPYVIYTRKSDEQIAEMEKEPVPQQITRAQGKVVLLQMGVWPQVVGFVNSIEDPMQKAIAEVAVYETLHWQRDSQFLNTAAAALGITDEQMDELFIQANKITL